MNKFLENKKNDSLKRGWTTSTRIILTVELQSIKKTDEIKPEQIQASMRFKPDPPSILDRFSTWK